MKRFLILAIVVGGLVFGFGVEMVGAVEIPPEKNPLCWEEQACAAIVKKNWGEGSYVKENNFVSGKESKECGSRGYCIPATKAQTAITVGENSVFDNLGDYIKKIYIYLISIGGLIAAILVIKGGFEYVTSTGNSQRVEGAKETIRNALIGLALLLGSYTLLYTINPDLLKLKLPRTFMIREIAMPSRWCKDAGVKGANLALAVEYQGDKKVETKFEDVKGYTLPRISGVCGNQYFIDGGGKNTCAGHLCQTSNGTAQVCVPNVTGDKDSCKTGVMSGTITGSIDFPFVKSMALWGFCETTGAAHLFNDQKNILADDPQKRTQSYIFVDSSSNSLENLKSWSGCNKVAGFYITINSAVEADRRDIGFKDGAWSVNLTKLLEGKNLQERIAAFKQYIIPIDRLVSGNATVDMNLISPEFP